MIISASRRTDIPCYYAEWFMNRMRAGYVLTRNPMNHAQISKIPLTPDVVDAIVFWTKDPLKLMPYLDELDGMGYYYYFQFTLTPYGRDLEKNLRPKEALEKTFIRLSQRIGRERVVWRYDPIILNQQLDIRYHMEQFRRMCGKLSPYTDTVTVSFVDLYAKLKTPLIRPITREEMEALAAFFGCVSKEAGLNAVTCCENGDFSKYGILPPHCIDKARLERILGCPLEVRPDSHPRRGCGCYESIDIGAYHTCRNGCIYCYANGSDAAATRNWADHDPKGELLLGQILPGEQVKERKVKSNKLEQTSLF